MKKMFDFDIIEELSWTDIGAGFDGIKLIDVIKHDKRRWSRSVDYIFSTTVDGKFWRVSYEEGLTENQDSEWNSTRVGNEIEADEVIQTATVVTKYSYELAP